MLEWLKEILGESYTEDADKKISQEIGKNFVAKADFNAKNEALKSLEAQVRERDAQLETLRASTGNVETLKQQIADLQAQNVAAKSEYEAEITRVRLDGAVDAALTAAGARNNTAVKALLTDFLKDATLSDDGTVRGLSDELAGMAKADATAFLFKTGGDRQFRGMQPGTADGKTTPIWGKETKDMSYDELCAYLEANPDAQLG